MRLFGVLTEIDVKATMKMKCLTSAPIRRATRKQYSAEEKIRIMLDGLKGEDSIAELCRREEISKASNANGPRTAWRLASGVWQAIGCNLKLRSEGSCGRTDTRTASA
ncbi:hypothetical protein SAMN05444851_3050 [Aliiroseovarius sediminilitoris]|uniref:Transposase n=1 Tax=Aliiroseovarius sediminilitoris TaxID=1173584 RepID=A0A1I0QX57_9RHOB|nr:hypothetical protein SAMN05444851_3050 [Aliiroseovarius sediminilitoris]